MNLAERFWSKVSVRGDDECWLWQAGTVMGRGYGLFDAWGRKELAHRVAWLLTHEGIIPDGLQVLHTCDVPACVNLNHLWLGTQADNLRDMDAKGRRAVGEAHGSAKLTEPQVSLIRLLHAGGKLSQQQLAHIFGVHRGTIRPIIAGKTWQAVAGA